jgi:RNA-directed DNA polymerase
MESVTTFIESTLKLKVNREKSAVDRPWKRKFLGFSFTFHKKSKVRIPKESIKRVKKRIRELTSRSKPIPMERRIERLNQYLIGWCGYYALADTPTTFKELDEWTRRRLRMCQWKEWKKPKTKVRKLIGLGVSREKAYEWGNSRKKYWRIAKSPILQRTLTNSYWSSQGLKSLYVRYSQLRQT